MEILRDISLKPFTSIKIGGTASLYAEPKKIEDLRYLINLSRDRDLPVLVLGGGSNVVLGDVKGVVISMSGLRGVEITETQEGAKIKALAGTPLKEVINLSLQMNLEGIHRLLGFPASVGGAVAMNAGAFGVEVADFLEEVTFLSWEGELITMNREDLEFSYRSSPFPRKGLVVEVAFRLTRADRDVIEEYRDIRKKRKKTQPINKPTSGSTFKNPYPKYAGELLERAGLKGYLVGEVGFSDLHANFMVNLGNGAYQQVLDLIAEAKRRVYEEFGVHLEEEVRLIEDSGLDGWKIL